MVKRLESMAVLWDQSSVSHFRPSGAILYSVSRTGSLVPIEMREVTFRGKESLARVGDTH